MSGEWGEEDTKERAAPNPMIIPAARVTNLNKTCPLL